MFYPPPAPVPTVARTVVDLRGTRPETRCQSSASLLRLYFRAAAAAGAARVKGCVERVGQVWHNRKRSPLTPAVVVVAGTDINAVQLL